MSENWKTATQETIVAGSGFLRLIPLMTADEMRKIKFSTEGNFDTAIDIVQVTDENVKIPDIAPKPEKKEKDLSTGVKVVYQLSTTRVDITSGETIGEETEYSFEIKAVLTAGTYQSIKANMKNPFVAVKGMGLKASGGSIGFQYLLGYIKGIEYPTKGEIGEITITVTGGAPFVFDESVSDTQKSSYLQELNTKIGASITPVGKEAITPSTLGSTDLDLLLTGVVVEK